MSKKSNQPIIGKTVDISVVIPCWNEEKLISKLLESLVRQKTNLNFEVIFVDSKSTDNTVKIIQKYKNKIANLCVITEPGRGIGLARERGHKIARGKIIASTDADCELTENWIERIYEVFQKNNQVVGLVGLFIFREKGKLFNQIFKLTTMLSDSLHRLIKGSWGFRGMNFAVTKNAWEKSGGFNTKVSALEDIDLSLRVAKLGKIVYLPDLVVKTTYRRYQGRFGKQLWKRLRAYYWRAILRDTSHELEWEQIR